PFMRRTPLPSISLFFKGLLLVLTVAMFLFYRQTEQRWLYLIPGVVAVAVRVTGYFISSFKR
ncbi:hypothetical protein, partial [Porphyromonas gingivalis]|uniref:hypothetical protein n=1 Tax=Porphyromonas gingivalis TaxID=837 RepID=UPI000B64B785